MVNPAVISSGCACPPDSSQWGSYLLHILKKDQNENFQNIDCSMFGCARSYYLLPVDMFIITIIFLITNIFIYQRYKNYKAIIRES